ncbi:MAG: GNAT family N-acetyltransferase [Salinivirgaceae bacterium]|nr:GNAT family N-acetyltransferase [Salinivirgaceae bacterium]
MDLRKPKRYLKLSLWLSVFRYHQLINDNGWRYGQKGIGKVALLHLEQKAVETGIRNLIAIISGDNSGSIHLFEKMGYSKCAHFKNVGEKFGKVLDVVAYQKEL